MSTLRAGVALRHVDDQWRVELGPDYALLRFAAPQRVLSFAPYGGGRRDTTSVAILQTSNAELPLGRDPLQLMAARMSELDAEGVAMLTSRRVGSLELARHDHPELSARVAVTAGLTNAVRIGDTPGPLRGFGTINIVAHVDVSLSELALLEALSLVAEARTLAVLESRETSRRSHELATGTGTDCIVMCCPARGEGLAYAGKHTPAGHVLGSAVLRAVRAAIGAWRLEHPTYSSQLT
jgi:adenosylcobinamide amidohydrolase